MSQVNLRRSSLAITIRQAQGEDAVGIQRNVVDKLDMTNATSFVWPTEETAQRIDSLNPLTLVAVVVAADGEESIVGVAGIDIQGMEKSFPYASTAATDKWLAVVDVPSNYCMCRGLLVSPEYQRFGVGGRLHEERIRLATKLGRMPFFVLSSRGVSYDHTLLALTKLEKALAADDDAADGELLGSPVAPLSHRLRSTLCATTDAFTDSERFRSLRDDFFADMTFETSMGVVKLAVRHNWTLAGFDCADGGCVFIKAAEDEAQAQSSRRGSLSRRSSWVSLQTSQPSG